MKEFKAPLMLQQAVQQMLNSEKLVNSAELLEVLEDQAVYKMAIRGDLKYFDVHISVNFKKIIDTRYDFLCHCECEKFQSKKYCEHAIAALVLTSCGVGYFDIQRLHGKNYYLSESNIDVAKLIKAEFQKIEKYEMPSAIVIVPLGKTYLNGRQIKESDFIACQNLVSRELEPISDHSVAPANLLGNNIQLVWDDLRVVTLRDNFTDKNYLPIRIYNDILAVLKRKDPSAKLFGQISDYFLNRVGQTSYYFSNKDQDESLYSKLLQSLKEICDKHQIPLFFSPIGNARVTRRVYELNSIEFWDDIKFPEVSSQSRFKVSLGKKKDANLGQYPLVVQCFNPEMNDQSVAFFDGYWNPLEKKYVYYNMGAQFLPKLDHSSFSPEYYSINSRVKSNPSDQLVIQDLAKENSASNFLTELNLISSQFWFHSLRRGLDVLNNFNQPRKKESITFVEVNLPEIKKVEIGQKNFRFDILMTPDGQAKSYRFYIDIDVNGTTKSVLLFENRLLFYQFLEEGLSAFHWSDRKDLASRRRQHRANDLKYLRHVGNAVVYLVECFNYLLNGKSSDGKQFQTKNDFLRFLEYRMVNSMYPNEELSNFDISNTVKKDFFFSILDDALTSYVDSPLTEIVCFESDQIFEISISSGELIQLMLADMSYFFEVFGSNLIVKEKSEMWKKTFMYYFSHPISVVDTEGKAYTTNLLAADNQTQLGQGELEGALCTFPEKSVFDPWMWMSRMSEGGVNISINQNNIVSLEDSELTTEFELREVSEESLVAGHTNINWFELNPEVFFKGRKVEIDKIKFKSGRRFMEYQGQFYLIDSRTLPKVQALMHFWEKIESKSKKQKNSDRQKFLTLPKHSILELLHLHHMGIKIKHGPRWKKILDFYESLGEPKPVGDLPKQLKGVLKPYQVTGFQWLYDLYRLRLGALLADDMGLGKTLQTLSFLDKLNREKEMGNSLVVVPTSLVYNWISEIEKFVPELPFKVFSAQTKKDFLENANTCLYITTYGLMVEHSEALLQKKYNVVIFDEAQNLKNISSQRTSVARQLDAQFKVALTGTPLENHYGEFYSLIDLILPGALGEYSKFAKGAGLSKALDAKVDPEFLFYVRNIIRPIFLRRTKKDAGLNLPPKVESVRPLDMDEKQKVLYRNLAVSMNEKVQDLIDQKGESNAQLEMLTVLLRLRQICSDPAAVPGVEYKSLSPKIISLVEEVEDAIAEGESVLVFTQFLSTLARIQGELSERGVEFRVIMGETPRIAREQILKEFQASPKPMALIMTLKTGGVGLNLTKASRVFHVEPWWNPAVENQATDRVHRMGQDKDVNVIRFIMKDTVEERIQQLKDLKGKKFSALFEAEDAKDIPIDITATSFLSKSDFKHLLS
jgi:SNF2 family DNA or RNA helicase